MALSPGRLKDLIDGNLDADSALVCHQTLPYAQYGVEDQAVCRGFYDAYWEQSTPLRMATVMGLIEEIP